MISESVKDFLRDLDLRNVPEVLPAEYGNPLDWFDKIRRGRTGEMLLLGTGENRSGGRFSIGATDPLFTVSVANEKTVFTGMGDRTEFAAGPLEILDLLDRFMTERGGASPLGCFGGGLVCLISYEMNRYFEPYNRKIGKPPASPDLWCAFYPRVRVFDGVSEQTFDVLWDKGAAERGTISDSAHHVAHSYSLSRFEIDEQKDEYLRKIENVKRFILEGEVYQVNLSRRLAASFDGNPAALFRRLAEVNPAPFGAYLNGGNFQILSLSPELFFSIENGVITTSPIKGTAPRNPNPAEDLREMARLTGSEKNRAENLMIVDLMRNDLGKVCVPGSIKVDSLFSPESLPAVHHLVSTISGKLRADASINRILSALWPGGSVTGAPKVRAMEIIANLETTARGYYCGSVVAWGLGGGLKASLLIRTVCIENGLAVYRTGGGIVADSEPENEFEETALKASLLEKASR